VIVPLTPPQPASVQDGTAAALLDEAEDALDEACARIMAEVGDERSRPWTLW
jgi:hypothetical protein